jgi:hypothetical protein
MAKRLDRNQLRGGEGQSLIAQRFEAIGLPFHPFVGAYDVGIDGMIELRDPTTGVMSNAHIGVQCKATGTLHNETDDAFDFRFSQEDLDYWSSGTTPVLLCVAHLPTSRVWWVSVRKKLTEPTTRKSRLIRFDKSADAIDESAVQALLSIAQAAGSGTYMRPPPKREVLHSNLLEVTQFPPCVWRAETTFRDGSDLMEELKRQREWADSEWFLIDGALYAAHDLHDEPWSAVCDVGTVETFDPRDWSDSDDRDERRRFVRLLNQCLRSRLGGMHMRFTKEGRREYFHFTATHDLKPRRVRYKSRKREAVRTVFKAYERKDDPERIAYYRHVAFERRFEQLDGRWYLRINPTYHYTSDGRELDPFREERLAGIKQRERNKAVGGTVVMFAALLTDHGLFTRDYPLLRFGELMRVSVEAGLPDELWAGQDELRPPTADDPDSTDIGETDPQALLFEEEEEET